MYSTEILDHFERPRNAGQVQKPDAHVRLENPACGDVVELTAKVETGEIADIRFLAKGCVCAIACASMLTEMVRGNSVKGAARVSREELVNRLGGLPAASEHAAHLAMDALRELLRKLR